MVLTSSFGTSLDNCTDANPLHRCISIGSTGAQFCDPVFFRVNYTGVFPLHRCRYHRINRCLAFHRSCRALHRRVGLCPHRFNRCSCVYAAGSVHRLNRRYSNQCVGSTGEVYRALVLVLFLWLLPQLFSLAPRAVLCGCSSPVATLHLI